MITLETYMLDGAVDLFHQARLANWHIGTLVHRFQKLDYDYADADAFARFTFVAFAEANGVVTDGPAEDCLTVTQRARIQPSF